MVSIGEVLCSQPSPIFENHVFVGSQIVEMKQKLGGAIFWPSFFNTVVFLLRLVSVVFG